MTELSKLYQKVSAYPLLTKEEERTIARQVALGNKAARERMIMANMRMAIKLAHEFHAKSNCSLDDLIQESSVGLMKAVDRYDPERGFRFSTYAYWWIKQSIRRYILDSTALARLPGNSRKLLFEIGQAQQKYRKEFGTSPSIEELADVTGASVSMLRSVLAVTATPESLDIAPSTESQSSRHHRGVADPDIVDPIENLDRELAKKIIYQTLGSLSKREEIVLRLRFGLFEDLDDEALYPPSNLRKVDDDADR